MNRRVTMNQFFSKAAWRAAWRDYPDACRALFQVMNEHPAAAAILTILMSFAVMFLVIGVLLFTRWGITGQVCR